MSKEVKEKVNAIYGTAGVGGQGKAAAAKALLDAGHTIKEAATIIHVPINESVREIKEDLNKTGMIIVVYPGMGQDLLAEINDNYIYLQSVGYVDCDSWPHFYIQDALDVCGDGVYDIVMVDSEPDVLEALAEFNVPYIIFYPATSKDSILKMLAQMYMANPHNNRAKTIADVILHHDDRINDLRLYPNSIAASTGVLNEDLIKDLAKMGKEERLQVVQAFSVMKSKTNLKGKK